VSRCRCIFLFDFSEEKSVGGTVNVQPPSYDEAMKTVSLPSAEGKNSRESELPAVCVIGYFLQPIPTA